jgi:hypothetical protein
LRTKDLVQDKADPMSVVWAYLDENRATVTKQFSSEEQSVPEVHEVGVATELPGVPKRADLLGFARQVGV